MIKIILAIFKIYLHNETETNVTKTINKQQLSMK